MVFSSFEFLVCGAVFLVGFYLLKAGLPPARRQRGMAWYLLAVSWWIYGQWGGRDLAVLAFSIGLNFSVGTALSGSRLRAWRGLVLAGGVGANLLLLLFFKYRGVLSLVGMDDAPGAGFLPLGISFFTFQQVAYLVDCHRRAGLHYGFVDYACFVSFYPQLVAGPIVRHHELIPQLRAGAERGFDAEGIARGVALFAFGLCKKTVLADSIAPFVDGGFAHVASLSSPEAGLVMLGYASQLYFDFSGYCDMAVGLGLMVGLRLPVNFDSPYRAGNVVELWSRWNITLGAFFRDYLFRPLGGFTRNRARQVAVVLVTMTLVGLWHGSTGLFAVWGFMHGVALVGARWWRGFRRPLPRPLGVALTFGYVVLSLVFFRAASWTEAMAFYRAIFAGGLNWPHFLPGSAAWLGWGEPADWFPYLLPTAKKFFLGLLLLEYALIFGVKNSNSVRQQDRLDGWLMGRVVVALVLGIMAIQEGKEFIYFVF